MNLIPEEKFMSPIVILLDGRTSLDPWRDPWVHGGLKSGDKAPAPAQS